MIHLFLSDLGPGAAGGTAAEQVEQRSLNRISLNAEFCLILTVYFISQGLLGFPFGILVLSTF